ncbi:hypothetical protein OQA88_7639 [Cercophora sp. LCS_1]
MAILAGLFALLVGSTVAAPLTSRDDACTAPKLRRSWHTLTNPERTAYINAELCLMSKRSTSGIRGAKTKFDDFQAAHALHMEIAHFVGQFLPFHRLFVWAHEQALEKECGYTAGAPYWDETLDAGAFTKSIVLDPVYGFGGTGVGAGSCIADGPFVNYTNPIGPGYLINDHCIDRAVNDMGSRSAMPSVIERCMGMKTYLEFWPCIEGGPHGAGHAGIGSQMVNPISSPGDPIFFLHHGWLDKLWAEWQEVDPVNRQKDIGGNNRQSLTGGGFPGAPGGGFPGGGFPGGGGGGGGGGGFPGGPPGGGGFVPVNLTRPDDVPAPKVYGDPGNTTTLNHLLYLYGLAPNHTIADVMDTKGFLCYEYD